MKLEKIYSLIPDVKCEEGCTLCCSPVFVLPSEAKKLGLPEGQLHTGWDKNYDCSFKTASGCSVYENRPFICRFFGCSEQGMFSCRKVTGDIILAPKANVLLELYMELITGSNNMPNPNAVDGVIDAMHKHDQLMSLRGISIERIPPGAKPILALQEVKDKVKSG